MVFHSVVLCFHFLMVHKLEQGSDVLDSSPECLGPHSRDWTRFGLALGPPDTFDQKESIFTEAFLSWGQQSKHESKGKMRHDKYWIWMKSSLTIWDPDLLHTALPGVGNQLVQMKSVEIRHTNIPDFTLCFQVLKGFPHDHSWLL